MCKHDYEERTIYVKLMNENNHALTIKKCKNCNKLKG